MNPEIHPLQIYGGPHCGVTVGVEQRLLDYCNGYVLLGAGPVREIYEQRGVVLQYIQDAHLSSAFGIGFELQPYERSLWVPHLVLWELHELAQQVEIDGPQWRVVGRGEVVYEFKGAPK